MACRRSKLQGVKSATWNMSSMLYSSSEVVDVLYRRKLSYVVFKRQGGKVEVSGCLALLVEDTRYFGKAVIRGLLVLLCLLLRGG